ncbi:MAG: UDP-N-acetylglucosamine diphosphorylase/glucosamine-1-phosphate N-acetyltransferase [Acidimicrobiia bacterium]|nr:bifunctional UDP-N-acetylglucosamine diphosphorylase/glucosamine-1-phosphate N-acetyltransferase GlmU [bacterium]MCY3580424.1 bifunctional UDP-N-acetylglucosamine diphosphorylase/glucosamine-1-phosphate N-acetyltransferase GlmU [bacterium]MCY3651936.1 bifunctional UDP-N-acetylglucosamine diphosphorylase/glucosamine-1-phosphate N-acetyltransferase GlmU [bacterium]MDE0644254.1 bifunctional UDP-N-acetylglucosamine diphosphorylase/glucosamine-1-phosphate N-acetyltransferase GlmU [bacterium]MXZ06
MDSRQSPPDPPKRVLPIRAVVLGAGSGSRMKSTLPKVIHPVAGRPMIEWVIEATSSLDPIQTVVVVRSDAHQVTEILPDEVTPVVQPRQLGTAHALQIALGVVHLDENEHVLVVPADTPLITAQTLEKMTKLHRRTGSAVTCLTAKMDDPTGYGRVVRNGWGRVERIVEHADTTTSEREINEINGGIYLFDGALIREAVGRVERANAQGEYYLPDVVAILGADGHGISAYQTTAEELSGINTQDQLALVAEIARLRINRGWMRQGVWMQDAGRVYIDTTVRLQAGVRIRPGVHLEGDTTVAGGTELGPDCFISDSRIGPDSKVWYSVLRDVSVGARAMVGPYASLRPGTVLADGAKVGTFVEVKDSEIGAGAKVSHLAYVGDTKVGEDANLGAGTITANYDGYEKHPTRIGRGARIGSNTVLVAPVEVGEEAFTAAGSAITRDVSDGALAVERSPQREISEYSRRRQERYEAGTSQD